MILYIRARIRESQSESIMVKTKLSAVIVGDESDEQPVMVQIT